MNYRKHPLADAATPQSAASRRAARLPVGLALMAVSLSLAAAEPAAPATDSKPAQVKTKSTKAKKSTKAQAAQAAAAPAATTATPSTSERTLSTVRVEADADTQQDGLRATTTRVGKVLQDPQDIPQAVTTVTQTLMEQQQVGSLKEALRNVSGLTFNAAEGGRSGDNMMLRGFYTFGDMYLDGIRDTAQYNRETFNLEQVDVLRGAGAMLFGRGQAGGVINQVSKTPKLNNDSSASLALGTDDYIEAKGDLNMRIGDRSAVRLNLMRRDEGSWRSNPTTGSEPEIHRTGAALSVGFGLHTNDELILSHYYNNVDDKPDYGVPFNANHSPTVFPSNFYWGFDGNFDVGDTNITTGTYTHRFSPKSEWRTQLRFADYMRSYWARTPSATAVPGNNGLNAGSANAGPTRTMDYQTWTLQSDYNLKFSLLDMNHEFLAGIEYLNEDSYRASLQNLGGTTAANPPIILPYVASNTNAGLNRFDSNSYALYAQDSVEFVPHWKVTFGARRDIMQADFINATTSPSLQYLEWSTRSALSYQPDEDQHYYFAYSDSFSPTADLYQLTTTGLEPERSQVMELGSKWLFFKGDLALRTALYRADKEWERNTDLESTTAPVLTKHRRTDGFELEAAGRITEDWEVFSGFAWMNAKILEVANGANAGYVGQRARNTPDYTYNLWTTYRVWDKLKIGGGVEAKGDRDGFNPSSAALPVAPGTTSYQPNNIPAYARWDAMASYEQSSWSVRMNVQNVFNTLYYDSLYDNGSFTIPGQRRRFIFTGEYKF